MNITLKQAEAVIAAAKAKAIESKTLMNIAVVDAGTNLIAFAHMDNAWLGSIDISQMKARTARYFNMPTGEIGKLSQPGGPLYNIEHSNGGLITFPGGIPIKNAAGDIIGAIGVSNFTVPQTQALIAHLDTPLATIQPEFSPLCLDPITGGTLDLAMTHGLGVLAWSPLGGGRLLAPKTEREKAVAAALQAEADAHNVGLSAAAMSWIMAHPAGVIPIVGTQTPSRILEAADVFKIQWTRARWYAVYVAAIGEALP